MCCELWIHRWGSHSHGCSLGNMDNKQIKKKRLFHIAINVLKKNRIMRDRVQWDWRVVNYELAKKCLSEEAALEVRPKGQEPVMKAIICPLMSRSTCMFMSPACWFSPHEPISLRAKTVSRWSLHHSPNKTEQSIG